MCGSSEEGRGEYLEWENLGERVAGMIGWCV